MNSELIKKWIEYHSENNKALFWAWEQLDEIVQTSPREALEYIISISNETDDLKILSNLGAGPLEDLLAHHGDEIIEQVEIKARQNPKFTIVVKSVWQNTMSKTVWERVYALQSKYS